MAFRFRSLGVDVEDAEPAPAVRRLQDHLAAELGEELLQPADVAREERARDAVGEVERVELLVGVAERGGAVHDEDAARFDQREEMRGVEVVGVDGRIGAHPDGVEVGERQRRSTRGSDECGSPAALGPEDLGAAADRAHVGVEAVEVAVVDHPAARGRAAALRA